MSEQKKTAPTGGNRQERVSVTVSYEEGPTQVRSERVVSRVRLALVKKLLRV